ncbi:Cytosolic phospholipase A2 gamma [Anabarilius grahami]|uniref:Cytosolic phospholipase A2 gamma n=1 Tax=Anabarilius grahami TaxID=495550 RepID=A0A3N0Z6G1_ANAGA|nr:Cytosolic phospholipase A2 gamma [Anabarilius grahami]
MSASKPQESGKVRIEPSLNKNEAEFIDGRRKSVLESLKKLQIDCSKDEVPNIALLGSGGGERAMVALLGSLVQLQKTGLLDCILYLSGVSGSTWCMASVYQEPDWSTKLETVKDKIIKRLKDGPKISWKEAFAKLKKYYYEKDHFSLTDIWAVMVITSFVKEIDEHTLTEQWSQHSKDGKVPFPIYTVIDKKCKHHNIGDPWFEITPHEAGYSLTGAFVDASNFGSKFHKGSKKNQQDEFDMLYLQDAWTSIIKCMNQWTWGRNHNFLHNVKGEAVPSTLQETETRDYEDAGLLLNSPYFSVLRKERTIDLIISLDFSEGDPFLTVKEAAKTCKELNIPFPEVNIPQGHSEVPMDFYVFTGQNTPTVIHIPLFNMVNCGGKLKSYNVLNETEISTVFRFKCVHVSSDKIEAWRKKYTTFQGPYNAEMITDLVEVAGKNIINNKDSLLEEIRAAVRQKGSRR